MRVSYDDVDLLKVLNMDPVPVDVADYLPGWLEQLDGKRIRIRGFMMPAFTDTNIHFFVLRGIIRSAATAEIRNATM